MRVAFLETLIFKDFFSVFPACAGVIPEKN